MGTPEIAVPALRVLAEMTDVRLVVTQPDRPAGRGQQLHAPAVKVAAQELGLPVWQPETLRGCEHAAELQDADYFIVMAYGELLRQPVLDLPRLGCLNLHASLLPRWRGASPLQATLRAGDAETGVCVMGMVRGLDAGPVYSRRHISLSGQPSLSWLHDTVAAEAALALRDFLAAEPKPVAQPQHESLVTTCGKLIAQDGCLDWHRSRAELERWVRAYTPTPGCWVPWQGARLRILGLDVGDAQAGLIPGTTRIVGDSLQVACADGWVLISRLQSPNRKVLPVADWLRGQHVPDHLTSP